MAGEEGKISHAIATTASLLAIFAFFGISHFADLSPLFSDLAVHIMGFGENPEYITKRYLSARLGGKPETAWNILSPEGQNREWEGSYEKFKNATITSEKCPWELLELRTVERESLSATVYALRTTFTGSSCDHPSRKAFKYFLKREAEAMTWKIVGAEETRELEFKRGGAIDRFFANLFQPSKPPDLQKFSQEQFLAQLRQFDYESDRLEFLRISIDSLPKELPSDLVYLALKSFDYENYRLNALRLLKPQLSTQTPAEITLILSLFSYSGSKISAAKILK